jgi:glycosyltransferase involved in cell wall biosynthesis
MVSTVPATLDAFLLPYARHFRGLGWTVDAAAGDGPSREAGTAFGTLHRVPWSRDPSPAAVAPAVRALRAVLPDYDLVHTHTPIAGFLTRLAARTLRASERPAVVYTAHGFHFHPGGRPTANAAYALAERIAGRWTDHLVVLTARDEQAALRLRLVPRERLSMIPGVGIDLDHYAPTPDLLDRARVVRSDLGLPDDARLFTAVARLDPGKNHAAAVRAVATLDPSTHLVCAGPGPEQERLRALALSLGVGDRLHLLGNVSDVRPLLLASRAMVLPSRREGLSRAVMESLALGVPVVGARVRGIAELVPPRAGRLVDCDDVVGLAAALEDTDRFPPPVELRERLLPHLQQFALPNVLAAHERVYVSAASPQGNGSSAGAGRHETPA